MIFKKKQTKILKSSHGDVNVKKVSEKENKKKN